MSNKQIRELEMEVFDLIAKITSILKTHKLWDEDDKYTFSDGDRWARFEPERELEVLEHGTRDKQDKELY